MLSAQNIRAPCAPSQRARQPRGCPGAARAPTQPKRGPSPAQAAAEEGILESIKRMAKKVQGALPIVGLISRLTSTEGGFDALAYPEYSRYVINNATQKFKNAMVELEKKYGKEANSRWMLLLLWMVKTGSGLVPARDIVSAARRMRVTQDMEIEIDRFDITRSNVLKKYDMMAPPEGKIKDKVNLGIDAICTLCIGLKDGQAVRDDDVELLTDIIEGAFPEADRALIAAGIEGRPQRAASYMASS